jgi:hypothetical protein
MSRRTQEAQRLAEDVAVVINRSGRGKSMVSRADANRIRKEEERERLERRASSMRVLLFRSYAPWLAGLGVFVLGGIEWLVRWLSGPMAAVAVAVGASALLAWVAWMVGRRASRWRGTLYRSVTLAALWLLLAAVKGWSPNAPLLLAVCVVFASSSWWKANRPAYPTAPVSVPVPARTEQSIPVLWAENLGGQGDLFPGSKLTDMDTSRPNCESYTLVLRAGKQSFMGVVRQLDLLAGGLYTPVERLVLEPHENRNPNNVKVTIVNVSPIEETVPYKGARIVGDHRHLIEVGPYGDGDGYANWRMWQPGEKEMTGSWLSGAIIAGTGIGKSRLMELLAAGYMASGCAIPWFNDPQGGASSPALQEYADWYTSSEGTAKMIGALERAAAAREKENSAMKWSRFDPSPERPGIVVFLDEGHVAIKKYGDRLEALARKTQKVGIGFVVLTHGASLESLGTDILRACLMANLIVMKTGSNQTKNLLPGLPVDPEMLPKIPGFGYSVGTDGSRTAPFRSEHLSKPEDWFARYARLVPKMDALTANAIGDDYRMRREAAAEEQEANRRYVAQLRAGVQPTLDEVEEEEPVQDVPSRGGAFQVAAFPSSPAGRPQDDLPSWRRVLAAVGNGVTRTAEIEKAIGLSKSQTAALLRKLVDDQHLEQPTKGVYAIAGSASPPER